MYAQTSGPDSLSCCTGGLFWRPLSPPFDLPLSGCPALGGPCLPDGGRIEDDVVSDPEGMGGARFGSFADGFASDADVLEEGFFGPTGDTTDDEAEVKARGRAVCANRERWSRLWLRFDVIWKTHQHYDL